jgi:type I restriction enzyme, S subunit
MTFRRYEKYKDSGVAWLGEVPGHWDVKRLKRLTTRISSGKTPLGGSETYVDDGVLFLRSQNVHDLGLRLDDVVRIAEDVDDSMASSRVEPNDVLLNITGASIGRTCIVPLDFPRANVNQHVCVVRVAHPGHARLVSWLLKSGQIKQQIDFVQDGAAREGLNFGHIGNFTVPMPPPGEVEVLCDFLDHETAKIDALVEEQKRLIELLKEKRQAVISHAVTKGLNPNAPMKDSGVAWLGEVPAHWVVRAIKHVVSTPVTDGPHETPNFPDEGVPFVSAEAVSAGYVNFDKIRGFISEQDHLRYSEKYWPKRGDIFMVKSGATTGVTAIVETDMEFNIWSPLAVIRCGRASDPYFVLNFMRSKNFLEAVTLNWSFGTQQNIGMGVIENLAVTVPPIDEQRLIAEFLVRESGRLDALTAEADAAMNLLQERRTALISAAVTGKIDVRPSAQHPDRHPTC